MLFLVVPEKAVLLPFVCRCVGYGGNNVGALSKSTRAEERERARAREEERKREGGWERDRESTRGITDAARRGGRYENEDGDGRKMKGEDSERGREYWLTCNTESGGGRDPANIKYIITFILISLLASVCLLARLAVAMDPSAKR